MQSAGYNKPERGFPAKIRPLPRVRLVSLAPQRKRPRLGGERGRYSLSWGNGGGIFLGEDKCDYAADSLTES